MKDYAPFALRIGIGGLFITVGLMKLMNPAGVTTMLAALGFFAPAFWTWVLILAELVCGAAVLTGFKLKYTTVPLAIVLLVAVLTNPTGLTNSLKDIALLSGLVSLWLSGPGALALHHRK
ncbi:DoxX family protein [Candidatus Woesearchaeota archaeon]|nr:DoxX family protein [Candidatus Woesearchaeota archaeon]